MGEPTGKRCTKCSEVKPLEEFGRDQRRGDGLRARCTECTREDSRTRRKAYPEARRKAERRWRIANPEAEAKAKAERNRRLREADRTAVFDHYGHECACCGVVEGLSIDHANGDGKQHRAELGIHTGAETYRWLVTNGFPAAFQVLCLPCNASKGEGQRCRLSHCALVRECAGQA